MFTKALTAAFVAASLALAGCGIISREASNSRNDAFAHAIELGKSRPCQAERHSLDCVKSAKPKADAANALLPYIPPGDPNLGNTRDTAGLIRRSIWHEIAPFITDFYEDGCHDTLSGGSTIPRDCYQSALTIEGALAYIARRLPKVPRYGPSQAPARNWTMPNVIGKDTRTAQNDIYPLARGEPAFDKFGNQLHDQTAFFIIVEEDLTGQDRSTAPRSWWQVCSSKPPAGETFTPQTIIVFGVVKIGTETCP